MDQEKARYGEKRDRIDGLRENQQGYY